MTIEKMRLKLALENAKSQIIHLERLLNKDEELKRETSVNAIDMIDVELAELNDGPLMDLNQEKHESNMHPVFQDILKPFGIK